jgi:hypothetical protein
MGNCLRQLSLLEAVLNKEKQLTSKATLAKYNLGTSANVIQLKKRLIELDIIDEMQGQFPLIEPCWKRGVNYPGNSHWKDYSRSIS